MSTSPEWAGPWLGPESGTGWEPRILRQHPCCGAHYHQCYWHGSAWHALKPLLWWSQTGPRIEYWKGAMMTTFSRQVADWEGQAYGPFVSIPQARPCAAPAVSSHIEIHLLVSGASALRSKYYECEPQCEPRRPSSDGFSRNHPICGDGGGRSRRHSAPDMAALAAQAHPAIHAALLSWNSGAKFHEDLQKLPWMMSVSPKPL